jgi:D-alanyl-D-alanine carboxypeptidase
MAMIQSQIRGVGGTTVNGPTTTEVGSPADPTDGFDPFGAAYQDALLQAGVFTPVDPITGVAIGATTPSDGASADGATTDGVASDGTTSDGTTADGTAFSSGTSGQLYTQTAVPVASAATTLSSATVLTGPTWTGNQFPGVTGIGTTWSTSTTSTSTTGWPTYTGLPATGTTGASVGQVGGYGRMPLPTELQIYANGQLPESILTPIGQGSHRLWGPAAESWKDAVAAAAADGIELKITDSYRSYAEQVDLAQRKGLYENGGLAAVPGTSNHGWGLAVDVDITDPATLDWIRANGYRFGFVEAVRREPWHWEYRPQQA